jgi:hypothetical protein
VDLHFVLREGTSAEVFRACGDLRALQIEERVAWLREVAPVGTGTGVLAVASPGRRTASTA